MRNSNRKVDYLGVKDYHRFSEYKVLYFPYYCMIQPEIKAALETFIKEGGTVIADEGFGLRTINTWMQPYDVDFKPVLNARMRHRKLNSGATVSYKGKLGAVRPFKTQYLTDDGEVLATFDDGTPALRKIEYGKGRFYFFGFSVGYGYYMDGAEIWTEIVADILNEAGIDGYQYSDVMGGLYEKRLINGDKQMIILQNATDEIKTVRIQEEIVWTSEGTGSNIVSIQPKGTTQVIVKA